MDLMRDFTGVKVGDVVTRMLAGTIPMKLKVTEVTEDRIMCGPWEFDRQTGLEIDEDILMTVSFLTEVEDGNPTDSAGL